MIMEYVATNPSRVIGWPVGTYRTIGLVLPAVAGLLEAHGEIGDCGAMWPCNHLLRLASVLPKIVLRSCSLRQLRAALGRQCPASFVSRRLAEPLIASSFPSYQTPPGGDGHANCARGQRALTACLRMRRQSVTVAVTGWRHRPPTRREEQMPAADRLSPLEPRRRPAHWCPPARRSSRAAAR